MKTKLFQLRQRAILIGALTLLSALPLRSARADVVVVANSRSSVAQLSREEVINIFMGRYRKLPDGSSALPLDLEANSSVRKSFYLRLLDKNQEEVNAYWARLVFSGRTTPPQETKGIDEMLERLAKDPHAVGYLDRGYLNRGESGNLARNVKVLFTLAD